MARFAEDEIVLPGDGGPHQGLRYRLDRQPAHRLLMHEFDHGHWRRHVVVAPSQSGKTLGGFIIPLLWHLFEMRETVVCGVPDLAMVADLWRERIKPMIERTRFREFLPKVGEGTRGGNVEYAVLFTNGVTLRFMTGGASDKARAGFTSRVLVVTEAEAFEHTAKDSKESNQLAQLEARTAASANYRIYLECTVTTEDGLVWHEYTHGSKGAIALRCPHCSGYVTPERDHLVGWREAQQELDARDAAHLVCPACGVQWSESDRAASHREAVLVHRGQTVKPDGSVVAERPRTETLGFRWTAANNMLLPIGECAMKEWKALRATKPDVAEREVCQFRWCIPTKIDDRDSDALDATAVQHRTLPLARGVVPRWARVVTVGVDCGKWLCHWIAVAWSLDGTGHVIDYGRLDVATREMGQDRALAHALDQGWDLWSRGWPGGVDRDAAPQAIGIDSGDQASVVYRFVAGCDGVPTHPTKGFGTGQYGSTSYRAPKAKGPSIRQIGDRWHVAQLRQGGLRTRLFEFDTDHWKSWLHARLSTPLGGAGALTVHAPAGRNDHLALAKHLTSEMHVTEFDPRRGQMTRWQCIHPSNHWWDAAVIAATLASWCGVSIDAPSEDKPRRAVSTPPKSKAPPASRPVAGKSWFAAQTRRASR